MLSHCPVCHRCIAVMLNVAQCVWRVKQGGRHVQWEGGVRWNCVCVCVVCVGCGVCVCGVWGVWCGVVCGGQCEGMWAAMCVKAYAQARGMPGALRAARENGEVEACQQSPV